MGLIRPDAGCSYLVRSRDDGQTWEEPTLVGVNLNETALLTYGNRNPPYRIEGRLSRDGGRSWLDPLLVFSGHLYGYDLDAPRPTDLGYPSTAIVATPAGRVRVTMYYSNPSLNRPANWEKRAAEARYLSRDYVAIAISWREDDLITAI
jgi:hypothetical protein